MEALGALTTALTPAQVAQFNKLTDDFSNSLSRLAPEDRTEAIKNNFRADSTTNFLQNFASQNIGANLAKEGKISFSGGTGDAAVAEVEQATKQISAALEKTFTDELLLVAESTGRSLQQLSTEISANAAEQARLNSIREKELEANRQIQLSVSNQLILYKELSGALTQAIANTNNFGESLTSIEGLVSGAPTLQSTNRFSQAANSFGSGNGLLFPLTNQLKNFGQSGASLGNEAEFFDRLNRVLPQVLAQVNTSQSDNPQVQINELLQGEFGKQFQQFGNVFGRITDQINAFDLSDFQQRLEQAPNELAAELTSKAGGDEIGNVLNEVASGFETAVNRFAEGLNRNNQIIQQVNESYRQQDQVVSAANDIAMQARQSDRTFGTRRETSNITRSGLGGGRVGFEETSADRFRNILGNTGMLLDSDVRGEFVNQQQNTLNSQRRFLTGEFAPNIQASEAFSSSANDKAFIDRMNRLMPQLGGPVNAQNASARLSLAQDEIVKREDKLRTAQESGAPIEEINTLQKSVASAQNAAQNAAAALNELADVGARTADVQRELAEIEQARTAQNNVAEELLRGGPRAARRLQGDLQATQFFASRGQASDFAGTPVLNRVLDFLDKNQNLRLQNGQGQFITGADLKNQLVSQAAGTFGRTGLANGVFGGNLDEQRADASGRLAAAGKDAVAAQDAITKNQQNLQNQFFGTLQQQNQGFLDELKRIMLEGQIRREESGIQDAQNRLNQVNALQLDAKSLTSALGTDTVEQARDKIENPAVQAVFNRQNKVDEVNKQFDEVVSRVRGFNGVINKNNQASITGLPGLKLDEGADGFNAVAPNGRINATNLIGLVNQERNRQLIGAGADETDIRKALFTDDTGRGMAVRTPLTNEQRQNFRDNRETNRQQNRNAARVLGFDVNELRGQGQELSKQAERLRGRTTAQLTQDQTNLQEQIKNGQVERQKLQQQMPQVAVDKALPQAFDAFNKNAQPVAGAMQQLANSLDKAAIPENIQVKFDGNVNVVLNGAEMMNKIVENVKGEVFNAIMGEINNLKAQQVKGPNGEIQGIPNGN